MDDQAKQSWSTGFFKRKGLQKLKEKVDGRFLHWKGESTVDKITRPTWGEQTWAEGKVWVLASEAEHGSSENIREKASKSDPT